MLETILLYQQLFKLDSMAEMSNNLAARWFVSGQWATPQETEFVNLVGFVASLDSRSLSVNLLPNSNNSQLCLVFEGPDNNITALYGSKNLDPALNTGEYGVEDDIPLFTVSGPTPSSGNPFWTWNKIAITLRNNEMWTSNAKIGSPFAITSFNQTLVATFFSQIYANTSDVFLLGVGELSSNSSNSSFLLDGFYYYGSPAFGGYPLYASSSFSGQFPIQNSSIPQSDVILGNISGVGNIFGPNTFGPSGYWVNDSTLTSFAGFGKSQARFSASPFPYTRLASTSPWNSEAFYMYHQINASMLAEDVWDVGQAAWTSSNISIATS
ncbi:hypothetical protein MMC17_007001 [Xylographa soralifera]|nr:hypothetical protein [Xylographa soralifera]